MMDYSWIITTTGAVVMVVISTVIIYVALIAFTRMAGVRSFSKLSGFDFAVTVAIGSLLATTILSEDPPLLQALVGLAVLFLIQIIIGRMRSSSMVRTLVDNKPIMLMDGDQMLEENMKSAKVTRSDMLAKLREANVTHFDQVKAVVMETTGDISVLHHADRDLELQDELLEDLRSRS